MVIVRAYAKINLILNIVGKSGGMHLIDSIVTPFNIFDEVKLSKRMDNEIIVKYNNCDESLIENDTAYKMALLIRNNFNIGGIDIEITKNIPFKAGIGGSSADAGAVAKGIEELYSLTGIPTELLIKVGSDVPYMYQGGDKRLRGLGEVVTPITLPKMYKVLLVDDIGVNTKKSYENYDIYGGINQEINLFMQNIKEKNANFTNALQRGSEKLNERIKYAIILLEECGFASCMTGSGSGVFGIAYNEDEFESKLKKLIEKNTNFKIFIG
jgi:4-diphosphocytidyl-2-C-methyl-D-erythritol kinase